MAKYTESKSFKFTKQQMETFNILEQNGVVLSKFVRLAISEKIKRDWKSIKEKKIKDSNKTPWD